MIMGYEILTSADGKEWYSWKPYKPGERKKAEKMVKKLRKEYPTAEWKLVEIRATNI